MFWTDWSRYPVQMIAIDLRLRMSWCLFQHVVAACHALLLLFFAVRLPLLSESPLVQNRTLSLHFR